jgi:hypothetical protein
MKLSFNFFFFFFLSVASYSSEQIIPVLFDFKEGAPRVMYPSNPQFIQASSLKNLPPNKQIEHLYRAWSLSPPKGIELKNILQLRFPTLISGSHAPYESLVNYYLPVKNLDDIEKGKGKGKDNTPVAEICSHESFQDESPLNLKSTQGDWDKIFNVPSSSSNVLSSSLTHKLFSTLLIGGVITLCIGGALIYYFYKKKCSSKSSQKNKRKHHYKNKISNESTNSQRSIKNRKLNK